MIPLHIFQDQDRRQYNLVVIMDINFQQKMQKYNKEQQQIQFNFSFIKLKVKQMELQGQQCYEDIMILRIYIERYHFYRNFIVY
ncbi:hypothetical protein FGO68_gene503 [Halteria grandinella]|uniref:Uncharacterized protein n=1 Tax=Halteria grandinella TaxID=5974 RepID=A0A8J8NLU6_HALGN|nr:hypothetical protein FGO68_gene503 [Halteria grandinella]